MSLKILKTLIKQLYNRVDLKILVEILVENQYIEFIVNIDILCANFKFCLFYAGVLYFAYKVQWTFLIMTSNVESPMLHAV